VDGNPSAPGFGVSLCQCQAQAGSVDLGIANAWAATKGSQINCSSDFSIPIPRSMTLMETSLSGKRGMSHRGAELDLARSTAVLDRIVDDALQAM
jgi:hypothetical protein